MATSAHPRPHPHPKGTATMSASKGTTTNTYTPICCAMPRVPSRMGWGPDVRVGLSATVIGSSPSKGYLPTPVYRQSESHDTADRSKIEPEECVLHHFRQSGVDPVLARGHLLGAQAERHGLDHRLDQRGRLRAHDVRAEQLPGGPVGDQLAEAVLVRHRPAVGHVGVILG